MKPFIVPLIASLVVLGLIVFTVLIFRSQCPSGQRYDTTQKRCVQVCTIEGDKYFPETDNCGKCRTGLFLNKKTGDCVQQCIPPDMQCGDSCYSTEQYACINQQAVGLLRLCKNGKICNSNEQCDENNVCSPCNILCDDTCCSAGQQCVNNECCDPKNIYQLNGKNICCNTGIITRNGVCCPEGWNLVNDGADCGCGTVTCPIDGNHACAKFKTSSGERDYCQSKRCNWTSEINYPNYTQAVCQKGDMYKFCGVNKRLNAVSAEYSGEILGCKAGDYCQQKTAIATDPENCSVNDCGAKFSDASMTSFQYNEGGLCQAFLTCDESCDSVPLPKESDGTVQKHRICYNGDQITGLMCKKGSCLNEACYFYKCKPNGQSERTQDPNDSEVEIECPIPGLPIQIKDTRYNKCLSIAGNLAYLVDCDENEQSQVFYKQDSGQKADLSEFGSCPDFTDNLFLIKNRDGKCLDGGGTTKDYSRWSWSECDEKNDWHFWAFGNGKISNRGHLLYCSLADNNLNETLLDSQNGTNPFMSQISTRGQYSADENQKNWSIVEI